MAFWRGRAISSQQLFPARGNIQQAPTTLPLPTPTTRQSLNVLRMFVGGEGDGANVQTGPDAFNEQARQREGGAWVPLAA